MSHPVEQGALLDEFTELVEEVALEVSRIAVVRPLADLRSAIDTTGAAARQARESVDLQRVLVTEALARFGDQLEEHALADRLTEINLVMANLQRLLAIETEHRERWLQRLGQIDERLTEALGQQERLMGLHSQLLQQLQGLEQGIGTTVDGATLTITERIQQLNDRVTTSIEEGSRSQQKGLRVVHGALNVEIDKGRKLTIAVLVMLVMTLGVSVWLAVR